MVSNIIKQQQIGKYFVSTVFLTDHYGLKMFETMIFEGDSHSESYVRRYNTRKEAEEGHKVAEIWAQAHDRP